MLRMGKLEVSVLLPVHNGEVYLQQAVSSVLSQESCHFELVVVNDGSNDRTAEILRNASDQRLRIVELSERHGLIGALNIGLENCAAPLVARFDSDDVCLPDRLKLQARILKERPRLLALGTSAYEIDSGGRRVGKLDVPVGPMKVLRRLRWRNAIVHPSVMFRRDVVSKLGGYKTSSFEDYHLWLRVAALGELDNLEEPLVEYRRHSDQMTSKKVVDVESISRIGIVRSELASSKRESVFASTVRQEVWQVVQHIHDRKRN
jgi:glycosyltransferase involved in cell wall biosynthesis